MSEKREKAITRLYKLCFYFVDDILDEEDKEHDECDGNISALKDCIRETRDVLNFLKDEDNVVEEWRLVGINAMFDNCNEERIIPYDLPLAIKGILCI